MLIQSGHSQDAISREYNEGMAVATNAKAKKDLLELLVKRFETDARVNNMYVFLEGPTQH